MVIMKRPARRRLGDLDQILDNDRLQFLAGIGDFGVGQRDEAPIVRPGIIQDIEDDGRFLIEFRLVDVADPDARVGLARPDQPIDDRDHVDPYVQLEVWRSLALA
jgi:hypothetical protein